MKKKLSLVALSVFAALVLVIGACSTTIAFLTAKTGEKSVVNTFTAKELEGVNLIAGRSVGWALRGDTTRKYDEPAGDSKIKKVVIGCLADYSAQITAQMKSSKIHVGMTENDKVYVYNSNGDTVYILSDDKVLITANPDSGRFFERLHALETIEFGENFRLPTSGEAPNGANGVSIFYMFGECENLKTIKGITSTTFNTSGVTWFQDMFNSCKSLSTKQIQDIVDVLVTDKATQMIRMFKDCESLTSIDLTGLRTPQNADLQYIFSGCRNLETINVEFGEGKFDTSHVIRFTGMFQNCEKLDTADFNKLLVNSGFVTTSAQVMTSMFSGCTGVTELDVSYFDTSKVGTGEANNGFSNMFAGCTNLQKIKGLTVFDVSNANSFGGMFKDCSSIEELDLSSFDLVGLGSASRRPPQREKYTEIVNHMFNGCTKLKTIYATEKFDISKVFELNSTTVSYVQGMFTNCVNLVGGAGTKYDASHTDGYYAHIDGGTGNPGYLTVKA